MSNILKTKTKESKALGALRAPSALLSFVLYITFLDGGKIHGPSKPLAKPLCTVLGQVIKPRMEMETKQNETNH